MRKLTGMFLLALFLAACSATKDDAVKAWTACQQAVKQRLISPASAKFPWGYSQYGNPLIAPPRAYRYAAWVDSENVFGAQVRTYFECKIRADGDSWVLIQLDMKGQ